MQPDAPGDSSTPACASDIDLVFEDDALLVLNKPPGLLSVPGRGPDKQDCLSSRVQHHYPDALVVHRLDMATSGLIVMARGPAVQRILNNAFAQRLVHKRYLAVVTGQPAQPAQPAHYAHAPNQPDQPTQPDQPEEWHTINLPIIVDWPRRPLRVIDALRGQPSVTHWRRLANHHPASFDPASVNLARTTPSRPVPDCTLPDCTLLELEPITGRSHQLRVHLQALGHPIVGDTLYASQAVAAMATRLLLHAGTLAFAHPVTHKPLQFHCPAEFVLCRVCLGLKA